MAVSYRQAVSLLAALALGAITAWAVLTDVPPLLIGILVVGTGFFLGGAIPAVYRTVPQYHGVGTVAIGAVATAGLVLGYRYEFLVGLVLVGAASALGLLRTRRRKPNGATDG